MRPTLSLCAGLVACLLSSSAARAEGAKDAIPTRPGITVDIVVEVPENARALVLLFEGGPGLLSPGYQGFAHRVLERFARGGIGAALIGTPALRDDFRAGLDPRFRESMAHVADIDAVITLLKQSFDLPVWILGVSNGTRSAANYVTHRSDRIAGVVLVSSSISPPSGTPIQELPRIAAITVPLLALAHRDDTCRGSPPAGAAQIANAATASPHAAAMIFSGGLNTGPLPCGVETHHQLYGIEDQAVAAISWFIDTHTPADLRLSTAAPK